MKVAILGGGFSGLASAYDASKQHDVVIFERSPYLGGLATGFKDPRWEWPIERAYHHLFANDTDIIDFASETGFDGIYFSDPMTSSLFEDGRGGFEITPFDSPLDLLMFRHLDLISKLKTAAVLAVLKLGPMIKIYENMSVSDFMIKMTGEKSWNILWEQLFRKKFGKYAEKILMSFMWARIHKRTKSLGYIKGGFQTFIDHLETEIEKQGVNVRRSCQITNIVQKRRGFEVMSEYEGVKKSEEFDVVISTLPSPVIKNVCSDLFNKSYLDRFDKLSYLSALVLLIETKKPILENVYWLNICTPKIPMMLIGQHTNFVDKKHYDNNHLAYIGYYLEPNDEMIKTGKEELIKKLWPYFEIINPRNRSNRIVNSHKFYGSYAQPLFEKSFLKNKPDFITPVKNFFIANLDMTYPYDRGTNYAVKLGRQAVKLI